MLLTGALALLYGCSSQTPAPQEPKTGLEKQLVQEKRVEPRLITTTVRREDGSTMTWQFTLDFDRTNKAHEFEQYQIEQYKKANWKPPTYNYSPPSSPHADVNVSNKE